MGSIVSGITDAVGITDTKAKKEAAKNAAEDKARANNLSDEQINIAKEQLEFQKAQYGDWKAIYGDLQENLGGYYKNLSSEKLTSLGLEAQQKEFQRVQRSIAQTYAQRNLSGSGQELASLSTSEAQNAIAKATIRTNAEQMVADRKLQFLGVGLGQGAQLLSGINNSAATVTNAFSTGVNAATSRNMNYVNNATDLAKANMQATQDMWGTALSFVPGGK